MKKSILQFSSDQTSVVICYGDNQQTDSYTDKTSAILAIRELHQQAHISEDDALEHITTIYEAVFLEEGDSLFTVLPLSLKNMITSLIPFIHEVTIRLCPNSPQAVRHAHFYIQRGTSCECIFDETFFFKKDARMHTIELKEKGIISDKELRNILKTIEKFPIPEECSVN